MDKKAKKILFETYWKNGGWIDKNIWENGKLVPNPARIVNKDDFEYAKQKGLMFDNLTISHDECIKEIVKISQLISKEKVAKAFLSSLSTRRLEWRSAIASYHIATIMPLHTYKPVVSGQSYENGEIIYAGETCEVCKNTKYGITGCEKYENEDLNVLNFERIKWGGVRHGEIIYTFFDLREFEKEQIPEPTKQDIDIFKGILKLASSCEKDDYPSILRDNLKNISDFKSNKTERDTILELLACIDVLKPKTVTRSEKGKHDWTYMTHWRGEDGFYQKAVDEYFNKYLDN